MVSSGVMNTQMDILPVPIVVKIVSIQIGLVSLMIFKRTLIVWKRSLESYYKMTVSQKGKKPPVQEPYYPTFLDRVWCFFGVHKIAHKLEYGHIIKSTYYCIKCGKIKY